MRQALFILACLALLGVTLLLLLPTLMIGFEGGFKPREMTCELSADGRLQVVVTKRVAFPANEWVDPSVVVVAELREVSSQRLLASERRKLFEDSDFLWPQIEWRLDEVCIKGFDRRDSQVVILRNGPVPKH
jgi:hypothetical protein